MCQDNFKSVRNVCEKVFKRPLQPDEIKTHRNHLRAVFQAAGIEPSVFNKYPPSATSRVQYCFNQDGFELAIDIIENFSTEFYKSIRRHKCSPKDKAGYKNIIEKTLSNMESLGYPLERQVNQYYVFWDTICGDSCNDYLDGMKLLEGDDWPLANCSKYSYLGDTIILNKKICEEFLLFQKKWRTIATYMVTHRNKELSTIPAIDQYPAQRLLLEFISKAYEDEPTNVDLTLLKNETKNLQQVTKFNKKMEAMYQRGDIDEMLYEMHQFSENHKEVCLPLNSQELLALMVEQWNSENQLK